MGIDIYADIPYISIVIRNHTLIPTTMILQIISEIDSSVNARSVLAFILEEHGTTNQLSKSDIQAEIELYKAEIATEGGEEVWEELADMLNL